MEESIQSEVQCQEQVSDTENAIPPEDPKENKQEEDPTIEEVDLEDASVNEKLADESQVPENESLIATPKA